MKKKNKLIISTPSDEFRVAQEVLPVENNLGEEDLVVDISLQKKEKNKPKKPVNKPDGQTLKIENPDTFHFGI